MRIKGTLVTLIISSLLFTGCSLMPTTSKESINESNLSSSLTNCHLVTFDTNGGSFVESQVIQHGEKITKPTNPTRTGYTFVNWTYQNEEWSFIGYSVTTDMTLLANWIPNEYNLTLINSDESRGSIYGDGLYTYDSDVTIDAAPSYGYSFIGWYDVDGNIISNEMIFNFKMGLDCTLIAYWNDGNTCKLTLDANGGSVSETVIDVQYHYPYSLPIPDRLGYEFDGWYDGSGKVSNSGIWKYAHDRTFVAHWSIITYQINYTLNGGTNNPSNPSSYTIEDNVVFLAPTKNGYSFIGWFTNDLVITGIPVGTIGTIDVEARWSANLYNLSITSQDTTKGNVEIISGSGYYDEQITVLATPVGECVFKGWYHESIKVSDYPKYTFTMPLNGYSLVAHFLTKDEQEEELQRFGVPALSEDGTTITYGLYPQTNVNDQSFISSLNTLATPTFNGWYLYNGDYYAKTSAKPYEGNYTFDNGATIVDGETYWFKCEPIEWHVCSNNGGECYILSNLLLDAHCYYNSSSNRTINGQTVYPNNYMYSDIRAWLNEDFYNSAFVLGDTHIQTTTVNNGNETTNGAGGMTCLNTKDKVFLPSYKDSVGARGRRTTDWARARGAFYATETLYLYNGKYWTRSPLYNDFYSYVVSYVSENGNARNGYAAYVTHLSVRPGITIKIT